MLLNTSGLNQATHLQAANQRAWASTCQQRLRREDDHVSLKSFDLFRDDSFWRYFGKWLLLVDVDFESDLANQFSVNFFQANADRADVRIRREFSFNVFVDRKNILFATHGA